ncbi:hypothetical protein SAY87_025203 [Trapa incisa]|uniref:Bet v I/Major latex protein domain-containing protein n=1 Tax=Trapa incisa TaxID=236973 RepID=A0AAN7GFI8_9MYRT|nr:hypothetical protein SAY87_025203 [Trapa incisa]
MGVLSFAQELESPISPRRLFKALMLDSHTLLPKFMPHSIDSIVFCQGHGDVGSIKQTYFSPGKGSMASFLSTSKFAAYLIFSYATHRMDELDVEHCRCKYTLIDSDIIDDQKLKMVEYEAEFVSDSHGRCICKISSKYCTDGDIEFRDEDIEFGKDKAMDVYLLANPDAYA